MRSLRESKPGWTSRVFGAETGELVACDAELRGASWCRPDDSRFLYRGRVGGFYLLSDSRSWKALSAEEARVAFRLLPVQLADEDAAFARAPEEG